MRAKQRDNIAQLILTYLKHHQVGSAQITARDIARFHQLPKVSSQSISALLHMLSSNNSTKCDFGFTVIKRKEAKKRGQPYHFTVTLTKGNYFPYQR